LQAINKTQDEIDQGILQAIAGFVDGLTITSAN
jgi:hypothetical protein